MNKDQANIISNKREEKALHCFLCECAGVEYISEIDNPQELFFRKNILQVEWNDFLPKLIKMNFSYNNIGFDISAINQQFPCIHPKNTKIDEILVKSFDELVTKIIPNNEVSDLKSQYSINDFNNINYIDFSENMLNFINKLKEMQILKSNFKIQIIFPEIINDTFSMQDRWFCGGKICTSYENVKICNKIKKNVYYSYLQIMSICVEANIFDAIIIITANSLPSKQNDIYVITKDNLLIF